MGAVYLVRFGLMGHVGRFEAGGVAPLERGRAVVVRTVRGVELGEVLAPSRAGADPAATAPPLRPAEPDEVARARIAAAERGPLFDACAAVVRDGGWPIDLIDVEPLPALDGQAPRVVLHYLGPHRLDAAELADAVRRAVGRDAAFEPAGLDHDAPEAGPEPAGCGSGGCGPGGGGCGSGGCGDAGHGCGSCAVKDLVRRRPEPLPA
jgi:hypothetical protein